MFDSLFTANPLPDLKIDPLRPLKGVIVGAGQVGLACAYAMMIQNVLDEMVLVDINQDKLIGEVMDLEQGMSFVQPTVIKAGTMADAAGADVVIITAGAAQRDGETRLDLVQKNVEILKPRRCTHLRRLEAVGAAPGQGVGVGHRPGYGTVPLSTSPSHGY